MADTALALHMTAPHCPHKLLGCKITGTHLCVSAEGPLSADEKELLSLKSAQLDVIRQGARVLLEGLQRQGGLLQMLARVFIIIEVEHSLPAVVAQPP